MAQVLNSGFWKAQWQQAADGSRFREVYPDDKVIWNRSARSFDTGMGKRGAREEALLRTLESVGFLPSSGKRALDIGSGTGSLAIPLAQSGIAVDALDNSEEMNAVLREKCAANGIGNVNIIAEDFNDFAAGDGAYDLVLGSLNPCLYNPASFLKMLALTRDVIVYIGIVGSNAPENAKPPEKSLVELITGISPGHNGSNHIIYPLNLLLTMGMRPVVDYVPSYWERSEAPDVAIARLVEQYAHFKDKHPDLEQIVTDYVAQRVTEGLFTERGGGAMGIVTCRKSERGTPNE